MKRLLAALLCASLPALAQAPYPQLQPGQFLPAVPPPPGQGVIQSSPLPPPVAAPPAAAPPVGTPQVTPQPAPAVQTEWLVMGGAELRALDKISARVTTLQLKTGETVKFGTLAITLKSCLVRPPERAADAAAFLDITDTAGGAGFRGWMVVSAPSLAVLEHPAYDVRPVSCRP